MKKVGNETNAIFRSKSIKHQCYNASLLWEISMPRKDLYEDVNTNSARTRLKVVEEAFSKFNFPGHETGKNAKKIEGSLMMALFEEYYSMNKTFHTNWTKASICEFLEWDGIPELVELIANDLVKFGKFKA